MPVACWGRAPVRLIVLLVVLALVAAYGAHRFLTGGVAGGSTVTVATRHVASPCSRATARPVPRWGRAEVDRVVAATGLRSLVGAGRVDVEGPQDPMVAWSDQVPPVASPRDPFQVPALAGYEIRWWSPSGGHDVADLFVFRNARDAARYVGDATSLRCRAAGAVSARIGEPAGARALIWDNPLRYLQADLYFSRGNRAYRVAEVPPGSIDQIPSRVDWRAVVKAPEEIASQL